MLRCLPAVCLCAIANLAIAEIDVTRLSLEELMEREFLPAREVSTQISDAPPAVAVVTSQDIQDYGYRTLGEILRSMRGTFLTQGSDYQFLGGRGFGIPGDYAGRVLLLIDGYAANENIFDQIFFGEDGFLDVDIIERVEYVPGSGSATYGNNAFLGSINVITKQGRSLNGFELSGEYGSEQQRRLRLAYGKRFNEDLELLASVSHYEDQGVKASLAEFDIFGLLDQNDLANQTITPLLEDDNHRVFLKASYKGWNLQASQVRRANKTNNFYESLEPLDIPGFSEIVDRSRYFSMSKDQSVGDHWTASGELYLGGYSYNFDLSDSSGTVAQEAAGRWWGGGLTLATTGIENQRFVVGFEYRNNYQQNNFVEITDIEFGDFSENFKENSSIASVFIQDEIQISPVFSANFGLRYDDSDRFGSALSPRAALIATPFNALTAKLSHGRAFRFTNPSDVIDGFEDVDKEEVTISDFVLEYKPSKDFRVLFTSYKNRVRNAISVEFSKQNTRGQEVEVEWNSIDHGLKLKTSYARQKSKGDYFFLDSLVNAPRDIYTLNAAKTLWNNKLTLGLDAQHLGSRPDFEPDVRINASTLLNLNIRINNLFPNLTSSLLFTDLLNDSPRDRLGFSLALPDNRRGYWLKFVYRFR